jgi:hypothetical protein
LKGCLDKTGRHASGGGHDKVCGRTEKGKGNNSVMDWSSGWNNRVNFENDGNGGQKCSNYLINESTLAI